MPDVVWVNDAEARYPEGAYYIEWYEGTERKRLFGWERCGSSSQSQAPQNGRT